jgi:hypothetical protein
MTAARVQSSRQWGLHWLLLHCESEATARTHGKSSPSRFPIRLRSRACCSSHDRAGVRNRCVRAGARCAWRAGVHMGCVLTPAGVVFPLWGHDHCCTAFVVIVCLCVCVCVCVFVWVGVLRRHTMGDRARRARGRCWQGRDVCRAHISGKRHDCDWRITWCVASSLCLRRRHCGTRHGSSVRSRMHCRRRRRQSLSTCLSDI